jgi:Protein of unknown function (DUF3106)
MRANFIPALLATLLLVAPLCAGMQRSGRPAGAANGRPALSTPPRSGAPYAVPAQPQFARPPQFYRGQGPHNGDWLRDTMRLPPKEQEKKLEQDQHFRQLPPQRQEQLRNRLTNFNAMPPQQRQRVINRMQMIEHLPPEQQRRAQALFGEFRTLDPQRKDMIRSVLRQMRPMAPDARLRLLNSPKTRSLYSPQEIRMLYDFNSIGFVGPQQ